MTQPEQFTIGVLAGRAGTSAPTIRYYESIGLLPRAARPRGAQRRYDAADVRRLTFIRRCREFGFPIEQVRTLVAMIDDPTSNCTEALEIGRQHLASVRVQLEELRALEATLAGFAERCEAMCVGGPGGACAPLAELAHGGGSGPPTTTTATEITRVTRS